VAATPDRPCGRFELEARTPRLRTPQEACKTRGARPERLGPTVGGVPRGARDRAQVVTPDELGGGPRASTNSRLILRPRIRRGSDCGGALSARWQAPRRARAAHFTSQRSRPLWCAPWLPSPPAEPRRPWRLGPAILRQACPPPAPCGRAGPEPRAWPARTSGPSGDGKPCHRACRRRAAVVVHPCLRPGNRHPIW
jgi:hypothetical protein